MKCTELVMQDHVAVRRALDVLDGMMKILESGERIEIADARSILNFLEFFGEDYHQASEEKILFPALVRAVPQDSPVHQLVMGHGQERALVDWIKEAFWSRRVKDFVYSSRRLSTLLRTHLDQEETVLGELAGRLLSKEEDDAVVAEFMKNRKEPETMVNFSRLERKYTSKTAGSSLQPAEPSRARAASYT